MKEENHDHEHMPLTPAAALRPVTVCPHKLQHHQQMTRPSGITGKADETFCDHVNDLKPLSHEADVLDFSSEAFVFTSLLNPGLSAVWSYN